MGGAPRGALLRGNCVIETTSPGFESLLAHQFFSRRSSYFSFVVASLKGTFFHRVTARWNGRKALSSRPLRFFFCRLPSYGTQPAMVGAVLRFGLSVGSFLALSSASAMDFTPADSAHIAELCGQALLDAGAPGYEVVAAVRRALVRRFTAFAPEGIQTRVLEAEPEVSDALRANFLATMPLHLRAGLASPEAPLDPFRDIGLRFFSGAELVGEATIRLVLPSVNISTSPYSVAEPYLRVHIAKLVLGPKAQKEHIGVRIAEIIGNECPPGSRISMWVQHGESVLALTSMAVQFSLETLGSERKAGPMRRSLSLLDDTFGYGLSENGTVTERMNEALRLAEVRATVPLLHVLERKGFHSPFLALFDSAHENRFYLEMQPPRR